MEYENYHIYAVEGTDALKVVQDFLVDRVARSVNAEEWAKSHGGKSPLSRGQFLCGIVTNAGEKPNGPGWKRMDHQPDNGDVWWAYNWRTKAGKDIEREINRDDLRQATSTGLGYALVGSKVKTHREPAPSGGFYLYEPQAWEMGDRVFLIVPKVPGEPAPDIDGCRPLKMSEFYAIKENEGAGV